MDTRQIMPDSVSPSQESPIILFFSVYDVPATTKQVSRCKNFNILYVTFPRFCEYVG